VRGKLRSTKNTHDGAVDRSTLIIRAIAGNRSLRGLVKPAARAFPASSRHPVGVALDTPSIASINVRYPTAELLNARNAIWNARFSLQSRSISTVVILTTNITISERPTTSRLGKGIPGECVMRYLPARKSSRGHACMRVSAITIISIYCNNYH